MQVNSTTQTKAPAATIPAHVLERLENEWRQMRLAGPQPVAATAK
ncbi:MULTISPECIES: hypothetical protein [Alphaproteobacteria]|uniref:Uncharacterized protein n=2 Tax=Alphaproteobacteria TaxID=28211 RepID=A0A512HG10_9HYPH|nr:MULTISPECIES: hypothetical protein [Alphaproteobacteria]GEO84371.1 hypothetical protein RNA01_13030 [Ciceribacter naphthalenivorans]GLR22334.1 hypothetical protein GCM10007920_21210 [Ciceribacter naphthalenivorans]GLT05190.1 hypothetical protein GCM10007926_21210 [Sphingomonas psychrolutea]